MHRLVMLVKRAVEEYVNTGNVISTPGDLDEEMGQRAGVFVCLKKHGRLRGCIGTIRPVAECVASEAIRNAVGAATEDPRFKPVEEDELKDIEYSVDVLCLPERVDDIEELDPEKYGVIVSKEHRRGLLLPDLEGVGTAEEQLRIAKMKAGIDPDEKDVLIERFEVKRFK